ncbi:hypothetical protein BU17DRAFT_63279 [Hysterangium stoloniferum]|nr:hypothetical protein BU17DRAFT_63279 [Hysterangium stoloniferum]
MASFKLTWIHRRTTNHINWHFLITACLMWVATGVNFALSWSRVMDGFIFLQPDLRTNPRAIDDYFLNLRHWKEVARTGVYIALTAVADSLFIYRLYIVYGHSKTVIILPVLLLCGSIVVFVAAGIGIEVVIGTTSSELFGSGLMGWLASFFSLSLVQNVLTTLLIVYRIWRVNMEVSLYPNSRSLWPVMAIVLESGALYSGTLLVLLCAYVADCFAQYIVPAALDILVPIIGITFNLIIVRVGLGMSHNFSGIRNVPNPPRPSIAILPLQKKPNINVSRLVDLERKADRNTSLSADTKAAYGDEGSDNLEGYSLRDRFLSISLKGGI